MKSNHGFERRQQPQNSLKAMQAALVEIDWSIKQITSQKFIAPQGTSLNESFGYEVKIPRDLSHIRKLWVGYVSHKDVPAGIYAGTTILPASQSTPALSNGYRMSPFGEFILLKQLIPQRKLEEMEKQLGLADLKKQFKNILKKVYPFSLK